MKKIFFILILILYVIYGGYAQNNEHAAVLEQMYEKGLYKEIIKYKRKKTNIFSAKALYYKGLAYFKTEDDQSALKYFDLAIKKGPVNEYMYYYKGLSHVFLGEYKKSIECFDNAIDIKDDDPDFYGIKGEVYAQIEKFDSALFFLNVASQFPDCNPRVFILMGSIYEQQGDYVNSSNSFQNALEKLEPNTDEHKSCSFNLGLTLQLLENYEGFKNTFESHVILYPNDYQAISKLIQAYYATKEYEKTKSLKDTLYKAFKEKKLPEFMEKMFCISQFSHEEKTVYAFEVFDEFDEEFGITKNKFIIPVNEEQQWIIRVESDTNRIDSSYIMSLVKNDTLFSYRDHIFKKPFQFADLKSRVLDILNNSAEPTDTLSNYNYLVARLRAKNTDLSNLKNDGSSFEKAVIVKSIPEEYEWIRKYYPGHEFIMQSLAFHNNKPYDILQIKTIDGVTIDVYFDISGFFGKGLF